MENVVYRNLYIYIFLYFVLMYIYLTHVCKSHTVLNYTNAILIIVPYLNYHSLLVYLKLIILTTEKKLL